MAYGTMLYIVPPGIWFIARFFSEGRGAHTRQLVRPRFPRGCTYSIVKVQGFSAKRKSRHTDSTVTKRVFQPSCTLCAIICNGFEVQSRVLYTAGCKDNLHSPGGNDFQLITGFHIFKLFSFICYVRQNFIYHLLLYRTNVLCQHILGKFFIIFKVSKFYDTSCFICYFK